MNIVTEGCGGVSADMKRLSGPFLALLDHGLLCMGSSSDTLTRPV